MYPARAASIVQIFAADGAKPLASGLQRKRIGSSRRSASRTASSNSIVWPLSGYGSGSPGDLSFIRRPERRVQRHGHLFQAQCAAGNGHGFHPGLHGDGISRPHKSPLHAHVPKRNRIAEHIHPVDGQFAFERIALPRIFQGVSNLQTQNLHLTRITYSIIRFPF